MYKRKGLIATLAFVLLVLIDQVIKIEVRQVWLFMKA